ncbi:hypothetical protein FG379_002411 [Cryptosporidium bovis]|uniref:uncharacterized protein n=1 Tax=Cryptosporidium bovis TaxID=310047 RepID=UPI00351A9295|nr:hypothetical protein FG379_002411 [Cryptosporidium bovis]
MNKLSNSYKEILNNGDELFIKLGLKPFILNLPFEERNEPLERGITNKIGNNFCYSHKTKGSCGDIVFEKDENEVYNIKINDKNYIPEEKGYDSCNKNSEISNSTVNILGDKNTNGFVFLLVKPMCHCRYDKDSSINLDLNEIKDKRKEVIRYKPILGSIVEVTNSNKRCIKAIFCERKMPYGIADKLMRVSLSRILIHSLLWNGKGRNKNNGNKVICISEDDILFFPIPAYEILIKEINMSSHWEENKNVELSNEVNSILGSNKSNTINKKYSDTINDHSDYVSLNSYNFNKSDNVSECGYYVTNTNKCPCLSRFSNKPNYRRFWEITESRLTRMIKFNPGIFGVDITYKDFIGFRLFKGSNQFLSHTRNVSVEKFKFDNIEISNYNSYKCTYNDTCNDNSTTGSNNTDFHTPIKKRRIETVIT